MTQRKNNYYINDNGVESLSCVCERWNFRTDKHQVTCMRLASKPNKFLCMTLLRLLQFYQQWMWSSLFRRLKVKRRILITQQTQTYCTSLACEVCGSLVLCISILLQSLDTDSHIRDPSFPGTILNFLKLSHMEQWKFRLKHNRTSKGKSSKYNFVITSKRPQAFTNIAGCQDLMGLSGFELFLACFSCDNNCVVVRWLLPALVLALGSYVV